MWVLLYYEYNFNKTKEMKEFIVEKLKEYNETNPVLKLKNFSELFEVLNVFWKL